MRSCLKPSIALYIERLYRDFIRRQLKKVFILDIGQVTLETLTQEHWNLSHYKGKVLLVVNTAVRCGFHYQEKQLINLANCYSDVPFVILNFPSNDFANQEPRSEKEIACDILSYPSNIHTFKKVHVKGPEIAPIYRYIREQYGKAHIFPIIPWNYTKVLINREGKIIKRFLPTTPIKWIKKVIRREIYQ